METGLAGWAVLVTGASGGIGRATVRALSAEGARVAVHFRAHAREAEALVAEMATECVAVAADLRDESEVERMYATVLAAFGRLDAVVANAGVWNASAVPLHRMELAQWRETQDADLTSAFLTCRGFLRHLADSPRESASLVLVGSTAAVFGEENHADYAAAKAGLAYGLTRSLKNEIVRLAPRGRVNCVCPGWTRTRMAAGHADDPEVIRWATATMPVRKVGAPEDVANAIVYLTSDRLSGHVSGAILTVAGGMEGRLLHR
jgi:3-oxoacyl-[acyl-carrier protein] reductase